MRQVWTCGLSLKLFIFSQMTELTELYNTNDMDRLKRELARLVKALDYKSINTLLRRNSNTWLFDTRELNEEIPCKERHFVKRKGVLKFETTSPANRIRKNYQEEPPSNQHYDYSVKYDEPTPAQSVFTSRIRSKGFYY